MQQIKKILLVPALGLAMLAGQAQADTDAAIAERLKPVGKVCVEEGCLEGRFSLERLQAATAASTEAEEATAPAAVEEAAAPEVVVEEVASAEAAPASAEAASAPAAPASAGRSGEDVYKTSCIACHAAGVAGAPLTGDAAAWQARYDAEGGIDALIAISKAGKGAMPPMGTCVTCTDAELKSSIEFMSGL